MGLVAMGQKRKKRDFCMKQERKYGETKTFQSWECAKNREEDETAKADQRTLIKKRKNCVIIDMEGKGDRNGRRGQ